MAHEAVADLVDNEQASGRFYGLVWPHRATVLRVARILTNDAADADDLAQETLLKAFKGIEGFALGTDVRAWLLTILRRTRIDRIRSEASSAADVSLDAMSAEPAAAEDAGVSEADAAWPRDPDRVLGEFSDQQVIDALQRLPEEIRLTLLLVDVEQMRHEEAADVMQIPVGTVKSRTHRGRAMLRAALLPWARDLRLVAR